MGGHGGRIGGSRDVVEVVVTCGNGDYDGTVSTVLLVK
jgi:hypothetical protein